MKAQTIYNLREQTGFCSGTDLHKFFARTVGDPSPSGRVNIPTNEAKAFMVAGIERQYYPGDSVVGDEWRQESLRAINAAVQSAPDTIYSNLGWPVKRKRR